MKLSDLPLRDPHPEPWAEGEGIPWSEPGFSERMLREHLDPSHDRASRRLPIIDQQVAWIHNRLLKSEPASVLDLGCGPGLYAHRLAALGHHCVGIDFSPASIAHARAQCARDELTASFREGDLREVEFGDGFALAMLLFGEAHVFPREQLEAILRRARAALDAGGRLLLELNTPAAIEAIGHAPPSWYASPAGLFSDSPHLCLKESFWHEAKRAATERFYVVDLASAEVTRYALSTQAYNPDELRALVASCGFRNPVAHDALGPELDGLYALTASGN